MSTPSDSTIAGKWNEAAGSVKQSLGETFGNEKLANEGAAEELKGHAQETWGAVKEGASDLKAQNQPKAGSEAHDVREKITSTAANVKEHIEAGIDSLTHKKAS